MKGILLENINQFGTHSIQEQRVLEFMDKNLKHEHNHDFETDSESDEEFLTQNVSKN
jgi:hypothetical protein